MAFKEYKRRVMGFLRENYSSYSSEDLADIIQKTFLELYEKGIIGKIKDDIPLLKQLCVKANSHAKTHYRSVKRYKKKMDKYSEELGSALEGTNIGKQWETAITIEQKTAIQKDFNAFVRTLPKADRIIGIAWASYFPDEPVYKYIGELVYKSTGAPPTVPAMKSSVQRIRNKYKEMLTK